MKRKALLFGNTGGLAGVKIDLTSFENFLGSMNGGAWFPDEIETYENLDKNFLLCRLREIKVENNDYVITVFSGHGGYIRSTILEINPQDEQISELELNGLAPRQLSIFDCCRSGALTELKSLQESREHFAANKAEVRLRYETRVMNAMEQHARLYACSVGEASYDTPQGAIYLQSLLRTATGMGKTYSIISEVHAIAKIHATQESMRLYGRIQTPEAILPKCLSSLELPFALRP